MATYADWAASRQSTPATQGSSTPVKLVIDSQGNVLQDVSATSMPTDFESSMMMMEETPMSIDDQLEVVQGIRTRQRSNDGRNDYEQHRQHYHPATLNDEQRLWSSKPLPPSTILLVIGRGHPMHAYQYIYPPLLNLRCPQCANIDTNWLLSHLRLFVQIEQLVARNENTFSPVLFILRKSTKVRLCDFAFVVEGACTDCYFYLPILPLYTASIVLKELDGLKHFDSPPPMNTPIASRHTPTIAHLSRTASTFILDKLTHRPDLFRGQKADEGGIQGAIQALKVDEFLIPSPVCLY